MVFDMISCQCGIASDGIQRRTHVMGHIGKKSALGDIGKPCLIPGIFKNLLLLDLVPNLIIHPSGAKDDPGMAGIAYSGDSELQILKFLLLDSPIVYIKRADTGQFFANVCGLQRPAECFPVLRIDPGVHIIQDKMLIGSDIK